MKWLILCWGLTLMNPEFQMKFKKVKKGMTKDAVFHLLGEPTLTEKGSVSYFEKLLPKAGQQHMIYRIKFKDSIVTKMEEIPGPCATGVPR